MTKMKKLFTVTLTLASMATMSTVVACQGKNDTPCAHDYGLTAVSITKEATCEEKGAGLWKCEQCGEEEEREIAATGHTFDEGMITTAATCTETGILTYICEDCGKVKTETLIEVSHTIVRVDAVEPTCTTDGATAYAYCEICGEYETEKEIIPALGHTVVVDEAVAATCTTAGKDEGAHCSICEEILEEGQIIPAFGHQATTIEMRAPTCTDVGETEGEYCSICEEVLVERSTIPALGHAVTVDAAVEATCTEAGATAGAHCLICGEVFAAQSTVAAKGHSAVVDKAVEATCITEGKTTGTHCVDCGEVLTVQQSIAKLKHTFAGDICTGCGANACRTTLTFVADDVEVGKVEYDLNTAEIVAPAVPEKTGYTGAWEEYAIDYESKTVNAVYTAIAYKIYYYNPNYSETSSQYEVFGAESETRKAGAANAVYPTEYTIEDEITLTRMKSYITCACGGGATYAFRGWYLDKEMTQVFSGTIPVGTTGDIVIYCDIEWTGTHFY